MSDPGDVTSLRLLELSPLLDRYAKVVFTDQGHPAPGTSALVRSLAIAGLKAAAERLPKAQRDAILGVAAGKK